MQQTLAIPNPDDWIDINAAADLLGVTETTVRRFFASGALTRYKAGRTTIVWRLEVMQLRAARQRVRGGA